MKQIISFVLAVLLLTGCSAAPTPEPDTAVLGLASYPDMAPYPNETAFVDPVTGEFDSDGFSKVYDAWRSNRDLRQDIPQGYADSLDSYFHRCIPAFLESEPENAVCSPLNIYMALAMLAEITGGNSRQEILDLMRSDNIDTLRTQANQVWRAHYCADGASSCILADSLWLDSSMTYVQEPIDRLAKDYFASAFSCDLGSEEGNLLLRDWINEQTGGLLKEQADSLSLDPQTVLALASTIYYRAKWSSEFGPENNTKKAFHAPSGDREVTFMNKTLTYGPYYWGDDFGAVSLGLEDGSRMWLFLPDEGLTPADLLGSGGAVSLALGGWLETDAQKSLQVNLSIPKFDVGSDLRLEEQLKKLGVGAVFDPTAANFSPILPDQEAWLDTVNHAARVKVDEEGVEAVAYTVMIAPGAARPPEDEIDFILDRPFLFIIASQDNLPLFAGIVNNP